MKNKRFIIIGIIILVIGGLAFLYKDYFELLQVNDQLNMEGITLLLSEKEVISHLGEGNYFEGMGGYEREYPEIGLILGFANDQDDDAYLKVSSIETENQKHSFLGVHVGDKTKKLTRALEQKGYSKRNGTYHKGEIVVFFNNEEGILKKLRIWFVDKALKDRIY